MNPVFNDNFLVFGLTGYWNSFLLFLALRYINLKLLYYNLGSLGRVLVQQPVYISFFLWVFPKESIYSVVFFTVGTYRIYFVISFCIRSVGYLRSFIWVLIYSVQSFYLTLCTLRLNKIYLRRLHQYSNYFYNIGQGFYLLLIHLVREKKGVTESRLPKDNQ